MKKLIILLMTISLTACQDDDATSKKMILDAFDPTAATLISEGTFVGVGHTVGGTAGLYEMDDKYYVVLDPFNSQNGPDLKVYLAKDQTNNDFVSLGAMKSTMGKQTYSVSQTVDIAGYDHVLIWCQQFSVLFGKAELL